MEPLRARTASLRRAEVTLDPFRLVLRSGAWSWCWLSTSSWFHSGPTSITGESRQPAASYARAATTPDRRNTVRRPASIASALQSASPERLTAAVLRRESTTAPARLDPRMSVAIAVPSASLLAVDSPLQCAERQHPPHRPKVACRDGPTYPPAWSRCGPAIPCAAPTVTTS